MEVDSPGNIWYICTLVFWFGGDNELLNILPHQIFFRETLLFFSLGLIELKEQDSNKEIQEEETTNEDKEHKESHIAQ